MSSWMSSRYRHFRKTRSFGGKIATNYTNIKIDPKVNMYCNIKTTADYFHRFVTHLEMNDHENMLWN